MWITANQQFFSVRKKDSILILTIMVLYVECQFQSNCPSLLLIGSSGVEQTTYILVCFRWIILFYYMNITTPDMPIMNCILLKCL